MSLITTLPCTVTVEGSVSTTLDVDFVGCYAGDRPSVARLSIVGAAGTIGEPRAANPAYMASVAKGSRVQIAYNGNVIFLGMIAKHRNGYSNGSETLEIECLGDAWLLQQIPIRGALVRDPSDAENPVKWIGRYEAHFNPGGNWNCIGATLGGITVPVFSDVAVRGATYQSPDLTFPAALSVTADYRADITAWTPRRVLKYLRTIANLGFTTSGETTTPDVPGLISNHWRSIKPSTRITWPVTVDGTSDDRLDGLSGIEAGTGGTIDALDRKFPDISYRGKNISNAIDATLSVAGTHCVVYQPTAKTETTEGEDGPVSTTTYHTEPAFWADGHNAYAKENDSWGGLVLPLQIGGSAALVTDGHVVVEFDHESSMESLADAVLVDGDTVDVETSLLYDPEDEDNSGNSLLPAWSADDEANFRRIINGGTATTTEGKSQAGEWAQTPDLTATPVTWADCDGASGRPMILPHSPEALAHARGIYPRVFRAFRVDSAKLATALAGVGSTFSSTTDYPVLLGNRPIAPEQRQFFTDTAGADSTWTRQPLPVRVEVLGVNDNGWRDAAYVSLSVSGDGLIWFDSLAEAADGRAECIYDRSLVSRNIDPMNVVLKKIRVNAVLPMDHRVAGYYASILTQAPMATSLRQQMYHNIMRYIDGGGSFFEHHQVASTPAPNAKMFGGADGTTALTLPLTRLLPPGSERVNAEYAARRKYWENNRFSQNGSWTVLGIRTIYMPGNFVHGVVRFLPNLPVTIGEGLQRIKPPNPEDPVDPEAPPPPPNYTLVLHDDPAGSVCKGIWDISAPVKSVSFNFKRHTTTIENITSAWSAE